MKQFIFWCYAAGNLYDWFIQASTRLEAKKEFTKIYGYDIDEVKSNIVCEVPKKHFSKSSSLSKSKNLKKLGFELIHEEKPRKVRFNGRIYKEGFVNPAIYLPKGPTVYLLKVIGENHYKIGFSDEVKRRTDEILKNSPFSISIQSIIPTPIAKVIETEILGYFKQFASSKEWLKLSPWNATILGVVFELYHVEYTDCIPRHQHSRLFDSLVNQLKNLLKQSQDISKPKKREQLKLQAIYDTIIHTELDSNVNQTKRIIAGRIRNFELQIQQYKEKVIKKHSTVQIGDIVLGRDNFRYQVSDISANLLDKNDSLNPTIRFLYEGNRILKDGSLSKNTSWISIK